MKKITQSKKKFILAVFLLLLNAIGFSQTQTITSTGTFTVPTGVTSITVHAWGGGGRGSSLSSNLAGGAGGGGAYASKTYTVTPGDVFNVTIGNGSTTSAAGGDTWFNSATDLMAKGGNSANDNNSTGANGGTAAASFGTTKFSGGKGANGSGSNAGGGGSSAGIGTNGATATDDEGADAPAGSSGGNGGNGRTNSSGNGSVGSVPGGGGGGAYKTGGSTRTGGAGGKGQIIVTWAAPEINVQGNSNTIADGTTAMATSNNTDFGSIYISGGTVTETFVIENTGTGTLVISAVNFTGGNNTEFTVSTPPATTVAPGGSTSFVVTFNPAATGTRTTTLNILSNDTDEATYNFSIRGTGTDSEINVRGNSTDIGSGDTSPQTGDHTDFGSTDITSGTIVRTFTIQNKNTATHTLIITSVAISGTHAADFTVTTSPTTTVAINGSTTFNITFNPSATGLRTATITIVNNDSDESPYTFSIQGTGTDVEINVQGNATTIASGDTSPATADGTSFGTTDIGSGTIVKTFTIQNISPATTALTVGTPTISGTNAGDFSVTTPATSVAVGSSTTFNVTFNPSAIGVRNAVISIPNSDANENPYTFSITGTGADPEIIVLGNTAGIPDGDTTPSTSDNTDMGNLHVTTGGSVTKTFVIWNWNTATMPLSLGTVTVTGANAGDFTVTQPAVTTLPINSNTTFTVTFNPSASGIRNATITIPNNDSDENPYDFAIRGTGNDPEINVVGNLISIVNGDASPSVSDNTDLGSVSIDSGSTTVSYTIQNTGVGDLSIGAITITGTGAAFFALTGLPAAVVAAGGSTTFQVTFTPTSIGSKDIVVFIANDDSNENPYAFGISGLGVRTYIDTDGDGVSDNIDIDDDNDGILDTLEEINCVQSAFSSSMEYTFLNETFGAGTTKGLININIPGATCGYCYEDGIVGPNTTACPSQSSWILDDGEYVVTHKIAGTVASDPENIHGDLAWNGLVDHTVGDTNGRMAVFNASYTPGIFYETTINGVIPNVPITYGFWALNILSKGVSGIRPNITVQFLDLSNNLLNTFNTGDIGRCLASTTNDDCAYSEWHQYSTSVNLGNNSGFIIRFINNAPGGGGNDLALDDITIKQQYCDRDSDGISNIFDLDSDNDGIPDIEEAGFKSLSNGKAIMNLAAGVWVDVNQNGLHDTLDAMIAAGTYAILDTDGDGTKDFQDLDSDNDTLFDVDEAGMYNGDGDITGDGLGDGADTDLDGILNLYDNYVGFGTGTRPYAQDTDNNGTADYRQLDSDNNGVKDIADSLYSSLDANNDGKIDGAADVDKDGILDAFDTTVIALGSPRDLTRKLFLEFDGRNDYAQGSQLLSGLTKSTIMGWIKLSPSFSAEGFLLGQDNFNLAVTTGKQLKVVANGVTLNYATNLVSDRWYHVAAVYDASNSTEKLRLYVNGLQVIASNNGSLNASLATSSARFTMAKTATAATNYFKGSIDEVRAFNTALTDDQLQKMVYQEIKLNGAAIRGEIIPKDIEASVWATLIGYYRMDNYKNDVIDDHISTTIDAGTATTLARIYNVKNIKYQLAPMPFITTQPGTIDTAVSQNNFVNGADAMTYDWSIIQIKHNIDFAFNQTSLGMFIDPGVTVTMSGNNKMQNSWYLKLDGKLDLQSKAQLVQTANSDLAPTSSGYIERDQQGTTNQFNYNYWCAPVGPINPSTNNNAYTVAGVMKDGTNPANPQNLQWTSSLNSTATSPITLSSYWIFKFQNVSAQYANWASVGPNGSLNAAQGYTLKGSSALSESQNFTFVGKPNNGAITTPIASNNLNLTGNPYPSAMDAHAFITANNTALTGTLYFWEHFSTNATHVLLDYQGGYAARTIVGGTPPVSPSGISGLGTSTRTPGRFIPVGQGFFVTASNAGGTITFNNAQRSFIKEDNTLSNIMFKAATAQNLVGPAFNNNDDAFEEDTYGRIRLGFNSSNNYHRQTLLGFMDDQATSGIDVGYDAIHIDTQPNDMYFMNAGNKLIIQGESYFNVNNVYPLEVKTAAAGNIQFTLDGVENFDEAQPIYIHDIQTGTYHQINDQILTVAVPAGITTGRFELTFTNSLLGTDENELDNAIQVAFTNSDDTLNIKNNLTDVTVEKAYLFNMVGQTIATFNVADGDQQHIRIPVNNFATGTYIVKVQTSNGDINKKIIIK